MALEDILRAMEKQAWAEISRVRANAEAEAAAINAKAEDDARTVKARHLASVVPRLENERARLLNSAKLAAMREVMAAREALLEEAIAAAQREIRLARENSDYPHYLTLLVAEVVAELGAELCIVVDARDEALVRRIAADLGLKAQVSVGLNTAGGLEASTPDGRVLVRNTFEARLERSQRYLRREIASLLAPEMSWKATITMVMPASGQ